MSRPEGNVAAPPTGTLIGHMEECQTCNGHGSVRGLCGPMRCGNCYGAGEIEVWNDDEDDKS